jgi:hypothetical protein
VLLRRQAVTAEVLAAHRDAIFGDRNPHLRPLFDTLHQRRQQIVQKTLSGPAPGEAPATHYQTLQQWHAEKDRLEQELARQVPEMNIEQHLRKADRRAVALGLPAGVALVEFVRFNVFDSHAVPARGESQWQPARYLAFVLPAGEPDNVQMLDLGEAEPIDRLIADFRRGITGESEVRGQPRGMQPLSIGPTPVPPGEELRRKVFDPLLEALGGRQRLLLSPDGDLTRLPFEVLPLPNQTGHLIDAFQISYVAAGRDVLRFGAPTSGQPTPSVIVADPDFDLGSLPVAPAPPKSKRGLVSRLFGQRSHETSPPPELPAAEPLVPTPPSRCSRDLDRSRGVGRLPGTLEEGESLGGLLGVAPWFGGDVLDRSVKTIKSPRILHLATHGFFLPDLRPLQRDVGFGMEVRGPVQENPLLRSGLILAGYNTWRQGGRLPDAAEDGMLTAEDVTGMDLLDTELVVLSCCDTGLGEIRTGEGVFGLRRAFVIAGAKTLVMSLWKVPDEQTRALMVDFYHRVLAGEPRAEALRQAQLAMKAKYPDPFYWGAFICQGDPAPLARFSS